MILTYQPLSQQVNYLLYYDFGVPPWSSGSVLDHSSLPPVFESRRGHIWRLFRLSLRLITFGGRSAHLAYLVHKSGSKTSIIILYYDFAYFPSYHWQYGVYLVQLSVSWWVTSSLKRRPQNMFPTHIVPRRHPPHPKLQPLNVIY